MEPVLILGAGINGAAVARDLALNDIPVVIVDTHDVAFGATSRSSRLIHGGLRYLEYADIALVRESLRERAILLRTARHFVRPLRLSIPISRRHGGLIAAGLRFSGLSKTRFGNSLATRYAGRRGLAAVRIGLTMYDLLAGKSRLQKHEARKTSESDTFDARKFPWLCEYSDAAITFPERFVIAMLHDGRLAASENERQFDVLPYHRAEISDDKVVIRPINSSLKPNECEDLDRFTPSHIVNATGAWGDLTLSSMNVDSPKLFAGTKGSHIFTTSKSLQEALHGNGIYAEADDGRMIFILPCIDGTLIGTTDQPWSGDPTEATATDEDVEYLVSLVNNVLPDVPLSVSDVVMRQAGVRPLPNVESKSTGSIPRGHSIARTQIAGIPALTLIGGKLTTCRALAEEITDLILLDRAAARVSSTLDRPLPGNDELPTKSLAPESVEENAPDCGLTPEQRDAVVRLAGNRIQEIFEAEDSDSRESIAGTSIPRDFVRWSLQTEWCSCLADLIERRLLLVLAPEIGQNTLVEIAYELVAAGMLSAEDVPRELELVAERLQRFYSRKVVQH